MDKPHPLSLELEALFSEFRNSYPQARKAMLPRFESLALSIKSQSGNSYVSQKCTSFIECCKHLARLRQPKGFDESSEISFALGDIFIIQRNFTE